MAKKSRKRRLVRRIFGSLGCLGFLAVLGVGAYFGYQQLKPLFTPTWQQDPYQGVQTEDMPVERGELANMLQVWGNVSTKRQAELGFEQATAKVTAVYVFPGQPVREGDVLVQLDSEALGRDVAEARADLLEAEEALAALRKPPSATERLKLESQILQAREALSGAEKALAAFDRGVDTPQSRLVAAQEALAQAQSQLASLRDDEERQEQIDYLQWIYNIAEVEHGPMVLIPNPSEQDRDKEWLDRLDMLDKKDALDVAKLRYESDRRAAEQAVDEAARQVAKWELELAAGSQEVERLRLSTAVTVAEARLDQLEAQLADLSATQPTVEIAQAEADVLTAQWALEDAQAALEEAQLVAPFDGLVEQVNVTPDTVVGPGGVLVTLFDPKSLYVEARVSDVDVSKLSAGQTVRLTFDAFRDQEPVNGTIDEIPPFGKFEQGITYYYVPISFDLGQIEPMIGMGVNISLPIEVKRDVLTVPMMAVQYDRDGTYVLVVNGEEAEARHIELGITDGIRVEIISGLSDGDVVRVPMYGPTGPRGIY